MPPPRPVLVSGVLAHRPSELSSLREITGEFQAPLDNSFYGLCTFHFQGEETEGQKYKLFGKSGVLPWALAMWPHDPATGWDLEHS